MKKRLLSAFILVALAVTPALAPAKPQLNVALALGGSQPRTIVITLSPDGRYYLIDSVAPLEIGKEVCMHPPDNPNRLVCRATLVASFEVNLGSGDDSVTVGKAVPAPVTLRGAAGNDSLTGGKAADVLVGGEGNDRLNGQGGTDLLYGVGGADTIVGGPGDDLLRGGPGPDALSGGPGTDDALD